SELQRRAQQGNADLQRTATRIAESRAELGIAAAQVLPHASAGAAYSRDGLSGNGRFAALGAPRQPNDFWQAGFDTSWELDLWGHARRTREGAFARLEAAVYEREAARVALSAEVARAYLQLRGTQAQLGAAREIVVVAERLLGVAESRERNGVATHADTLGAQAQLATLRAIVPDLVQRRNALTNALALLLGEAPRALDAILGESLPLPAVPAALPVGLPSDLTRRRPDIQRAEALLHAATAAIGVAQADFYPRVDLRGRAGVEAFTSGDLDTWDSRVFSVGPTIYLPLFQGGRLKQRLALHEARQKAAAIAYRHTVLQAWHEVDNALDALAMQQSRYADLRAAHARNRDAQHVAVRAYDEGATDLTGMLLAQRNLVASQADLAAGATDVALAFVALYKALGGGWDVAAAGDGR
ncbi:MAG: efflux transporter outer membrane subunit, partial [Pseudomonadota bacterium]|nr:efflux transporter outer membrane subunit [Pseudomonadota bacterium]